MDLRTAADLAVRLAREAGDFAVKEREETRIESKSEGADLVTDVDREAERRIVEGITEQYPEHAILGEEGGDQGAGSDAEFRWLIDPLDGTNNYVLGIDVYGVCITLCQGKVPVVAVVHDSPKRRTYSAIDGQGAWSTSDSHSEVRRLRLGDGESLSRTTVSFVQGYEVDNDDDYRNVLFDKLERGTKRVLRTWAPAADWGLLATGKLGAVVAYRNEIWDLLGGVMIAQEAGAHMYTEAAGDLIIVGHPQTAADLKNLLTAYEA
ncbi:inositol monophosphatase family protein [Nesterenkonia haasae]|uniref:inositol monophosphatase family protein n=1 Tax=Nesterenkonia haasae TaxID=2587813 RepID=UPI001390FCF1|nr:inositol monophosphatase family protein [Nesterenkonia haasae]NDK33235.1 inositol monophosphatase [Nesterenkonia haasae]